MKINKIKFFIKAKKQRAVLDVTLDNYSNDIVGTFEVTNPETIDLLREDKPREIFFRK